MDGVDVGFTIAPHQPHHFTLKRAQVSRHGFSGSLETSEGKSRNLHGAGVSTMLMKSVKAIAARKEAFNLRQTLVALMP
jgi:hypothetical protein